MLLVHSPKFIVPGKKGKCYDWQITFCTATVDEGLVSGIASCQGWGVIWNNGSKVELSLSQCISLIRWKSSKVLICSAVEFLSVAVGIRNRKWMQRQCTTWCICPCGRRDLMLTDSHLEGDPLFEPLKVQLDWCYQIHANMKQRE